VPRSARRAAHIIAVSENTRRDVIELLSIDPARVTTIYEGVDRRFRPATARSDAWSVLHQHGLHEPFVLAVGTLEPRKNYERLLQAYAELRKRGVADLLVIAGGRGWMYESIFWQVRDLRLERAVRFLEPDDSLLIALYQAASAFVYASLYEGFGIPPLEALACGAPVACSNAASLPEVVGDAALMFDPRNTKQIADCLERVLTDDALASELGSRGPQQAAKFSWDVAAQKTADLYRCAARHA
jgi:glycosyltransferase involved in cell wall biosynthesis